MPSSDTPTSAPPERPESADHGRLEGEQQQRGRRRETRSSASPAAPPRRSPGQRAIAGRVGADVAGVKPIGSAIPRSPDTGLKRPTTARNARRRATNGRGRARAHVAVRFRENIQGSGRACRSRTPATGGVRIVVDHEYAERRQLVHIPRRWRAGILRARSGFVFSMTPAKAFRLTSVAATPAYRTQ